MPENRALSVLLWHLLFVNLDILLFRIKKLHAEALYSDTGATLDDLREAMTTLEETARTARRVLGATHPITVKIEHALAEARAALRARETPSASA